MVKLNELMSAEDPDEISDWSQKVTGKEPEFAGWIRELCVLFSSKGESLKRRKNALYAIQTMWPQVFSLEENFEVSKELIQKLMKLIRGDIHQKVGELAQQAIPILLNVTDNFLKQKRLQ